MYMESLTQKARRGQLHVRTCMFNEFKRVGRDFFWFPISIVVCMYVRSRYPKWVIDLFQRNLKPCCICLAALFLRLDYKKGKATKKKKKPMG